MPDYTVKADVDTMLRANDKAGIRSAIGVGTTDAPTFLAQTLTGQSLTGTQATNLVDLSATWNTSGTPSALKLNIIDTASNAASNLMDLQVGGVSKLKVTKTGDTSLFFLRASGSIYAGAGVFAETYFTLGGYSQSTRLFQDDVGILAQRNGGASNAFRLYNATDYNAAGNPTNFDRASLSFTSGNFRIAAENSGTTGYNTARGIDFVTGGVVRMSIAAGGGLSVAGAVTATNLVTGNGLGGSSGLTFASQLRIMSSSDGVMYVSNNGFTDFNRLQLGGTTSAFPAIKRNGTGIHIVLADDSGFAPLTASTVVASTTTIGPAGLNLGNSAGTIALNGTRLDIGSSTTTAVQLFSGSTGSPMLLFGGVASSHPALKRSTTSLQAKLADDSAFTNIQGKLTTDTAYTATTVVATGYITLYDSTGTAYRVPCAV